MEIDEYLKLCIEKISVREYLELEKERRNTKNVSGDIWVNLLLKQQLKCYYCKTDLEIIQELVFNRIINPRKRGKKGFSGMHFELDHKNAINNNNEINNLVASCYYCNNDKSNTINSTIFENYFGRDKCKSFKDLFTDNNLKLSLKLRHHLKGKIN